MVAYEERVFEIIKKYHVTSGHMGLHTTYNSLNEKYANIPRKKNCLLGQCSTLLLCQH